MLSLFRASRMVRKFAIIVASLFTSGIHWYPFETSCSISLFSNADSL